jgi:hypothetical protein
MMAMIGKIYLYNGINALPISISSYDESDPQINNKGDVTWVLTQTNLDREVLLYTGTSPTWITNDIYNNFNPRINDNGHVVWYGIDDSVIGYNYEIYYSTGAGNILNISNTPSDSDFDPRINSSGEVVWYGENGSNYEIFFYDGDSPINISNSPDVDWHPEINNSGYIVWEGYDGNDYEIYLYYDGTKHQITDNDVDDTFPLINNIGDLLWKRANGSIDELVLAFLDSDSDGIPDDGDASGIVGDNPCTGGNTIDCDDNCINTPNADQSDVDGDGVGDVCDNCPCAINSLQIDTDSDGYGNRCDADLNNDGIVNAADFGMFAASYSQCEGSELYNPDANLSADNGDTCVNAADFGVFAYYYAKPVGYCP